MMTKHTPGPWVADDNEGFSMWNIYSRMSPSGSGVQGPCVAKVIGDSAEADANARLIAAAPELLEALKALHHAVCGETGFAEAVRNCSGIAYPWEPLDAADLTARAAIAKAKGEQP